MNEMKKFNEAYNNIISEGFLRKVGQKFLPKTARNRQLAKDFMKLLEANNFEKAIDGPRTIWTAPGKKGIKIVTYTEDFKNEKKPKKNISIKYEGRKSISLDQSDTYEDIAKKINKILEKVGSSVSLTTSFETEDPFESYGKTDDDYEADPEDAEEGNE
jgi:hypothetical protein